jgi:hypothetical protein
MSGAGATARGPMRSKRIATTATAVDPQRDRGADHATPRTSRPRGDRCDDWAAPADVDDEDGSGLGHAERRSDDRDTEKELDVLLDPADIVEKTVHPAQGVTTLTVILSPRPGSPASTTGAT